MNTALAPGGARVAGCVLGPLRAGHRVDVLLRVYAKCIVGQDAAARRRVGEALRDDRS